MVVTDINIMGVIIAAAIAGIGSGIGVAIGNALYKALLEDKINKFLDKKKHLETLKNFSKVNIEKYSIFKKTTGEDNILYQSPAKTVVDNILGKTDIITEEQNKIESGGEKNGKIR